MQSSYNFYPGLFRMNKGCDTFDAAFTFLSGNLVAGPPATGTIYDGNGIIGIGGVR
jgi:hypothetical protein